jgi:hypothetical protein
MIFLESSFVKRDAATVKKQQSVQPKNSKVCKTVLISEIEQALAKSTSKKIIMSIYPLKASQDPKKKDYSFSIKFADTAAQIMYAGKQMSNKQFNQQSYNYIKSLKESNIPKHLVPIGYYIEMNQENIKANLDLCMNVTNRTQVSFESKSGFQIMRASADSCKCPPECPCMPTLFTEASSVQKIIKNVYAKE